MFADEVSFEWSFQDLGFRPNLPGDEPPHSPFQEMKVCVRSLQRGTYSLPARPAESGSIFLPCSSLQRGEGFLRMIGAILGDAIGLVGRRGLFEPRPDCRH